MKVLFVSSYNKRYSGGITPFIKTQADSLKNNGIILEHYLVKSKGVFGYFKEIFFLKECISSNSFEIIHSHGFSSIPTFFSKGQEKFIISVMGNELLGIVKNNQNFTVLSKLYSFFFKLICTYGPDSIIVKSENLKNSLPRKSDVHIIPNGVNLKTFYPIEKRLLKKVLTKKKGKIILFPGNPYRTQKNFRLALQVYKKLENPEIKFLFLRNLTPSKVNFFMNVSDLVLLTSVFEGSPNVIKEAMACNRPIVSVKVGDVEEITNNTKGVFITSFKTEEVVHGVKKALKFEKTNGREKIRYLKINSVAKRILLLYQKTLMTK